MSWTSVTGGFSDVGEVRWVPGRARVYEQGWQSWSPTGTYPASAVSPRPADPVLQTIAFRPGRPAPPTGFQGEGLIAVESEPGAPVRLWSLPAGAADVPSLRVRAEGDRLVVSATGEVEETAHDAPLASALGTWADVVAERERVGPLRALPSVWCSWYCYWDAVREPDITDNLRAMDRLELPLDVVQVDDGWQREIGDWLEVSGAFGPLDALAARITDAGRRPGLWIAPFVVGAGSRLACDRPELLVRDCSAGHNWEQDMRVLDVTHPEAAEHLTGVFRTLAGHGFGFFKLDFLYAGALPGRRHADISPLDAYREGLRLIREAVGPEPYLLGSGAPLLPSVGQLDAVRVSSDVTRPDTSGRLSEVRVRAALTSGRARSYLHGRWWVNDPDCLMVRPEMPHRERWARHVESCAGLVASSDPLDALDEWGLGTLRRLARPSTVVPADVGIDEELP